MLLSKRVASRLGSADPALCEVADPWSDVFASQGERYVGLYPDSIDAGGRGTR